MPSTPTPKLLVAGLVLLVLFAVGSACWLCVERVHSDRDRAEEEEARPARVRISDNDSGQVGKENRHAARHFIAHENHGRERHSVEADTGDEEEEEELDGRGTDERDLDTEPGPAERMEAKLAEEPVDPGWAPAFERTVTEVMGQEMFSATKLLGITCRTSLCKMSLAHDDLKSRELFLDTFLLYGPSSISGGAWKREEDGNGSPRTSFYLQRKSDAE